MSVTWQHGGGAYLMKKEAAADEEGDAVVDVLVTGAGSPAWLELLSLQGVRVLPLVLVMVVTGAPKAVTSLSAFPINPWACVHTDTEIRPQLPLNGFTTPAHLPSTLFTPPLPQMDGQLLQPVPVSGWESAISKDSSPQNSKDAGPFIDSGNTYKVPLAAAYCN